MYFSTDFSSSFLPVFFSFSCSRVFLLCRLLRFKLWEFIDSFEDLLKGIPFFLFLFTFDHRTFSAFPNEDPALKMESNQIQFQIQKSIQIDI